MPGIYTMEVFAEGFQPREVQFAIVEQNPTLLNITLFAENNHRIDDPAALGAEAIANPKLDKVEVDEDGELLEDGEDKEEEDEESTGLFGLPNPFATLQKNIQANVDSLLSNIPFVGRK